jgi:hypothetical protein
MPAKDWGNQKNAEAAASGRATKLNRAIAGGRDREGFALVKASDLKRFTQRATSTLDQSTDPALATILTEEARRKGGSRPKYNRGLQAFLDTLPATFAKDGKPFNLSTLKDWLSENASSDSLSYAAMGVLSSMA